MAGLADPLALGNRIAEAAGARARIPELEAVAARKGSSRTIEEASRLHGLLSLMECRRSPEMYSERGRS